MLDASPLVRYYHLMNNIRKQPVLPLPLIALANWLLVLPATALLTAAALLMLQPTQHEPARTALLLLRWADAYIHTPAAAALLFLALPAFGLAIGFAVLLRAWSNDAGLREDAAAAFAIVRRRLWAGLLAGAVLMAAAILFATIVHIITD